MNTVARNAVFAESENAQQSRGRVSVFRDPAVSETGVIFDMVETGVDIAELLADTFDRLPLAQRGVKIGSGAGRRSGHKARMIGYPKLGGFRKYLDLNTRKGDKFP